MEIDAWNGQAQDSSPDFAGKKAPRRLEYFWLCEECAATMTVVIDQGAPKTRPMALARSAAS